MPEQILKKIHLRLIKQGKTVAVAESCSGGLLSNYLTLLPGSSAYFQLGTVTYSNRAKEKILKIPSGIISEYGAVSPAVALLMAKNVRKISAADFGLGITGIAGPGGASKTKPLGTVYIGFSSKRGNICRKFNFKGSRLAIRKNSAKQALLLLCAHLSP